MPHRERLKELIKLQGFRSNAKFCKHIGGYPPINLSNYLTKGREFPSGELIYRVGEFLPNWNLRYWLFGDGVPIFTEDMKEYVEEENQNEKISLKELREHINHLESLFKNNRDRIEVLSDRINQISK